MIEVNKVSMDLQVISWQSLIIVFQRLKLC